eukprot:12743081-Alexandrium_andersonii.AAC.1
MPFRACVRRGSWASSLYASSPVEHRAVSPKPPSPHRTAHGHAVRARCCAISLRRPAPQHVALTLGGH